MKKNKKQVSAETRKKIEQVTKLLTQIAEIVVSIDEAEIELHGLIAVVTFSYPEQPRKRITRVAISGNQKGILNAAYSLLIDDDASLYIDIARAKKKLNEISELKNKNE